MALLEVKGISKKQNGQWVVKDISFTQEPLQKIAIAGATGSGKTSLLQMIAGLLQPDEGEIRLDGSKVIGPSDQLIPGHKKIAYLSQYFELRNNYRVHELLEMKNKIDEAIADKIYTVCQISHLLQRRTDALSGGERQRIVLAGLLTTSPELLLLDEPFSNLDMMHKNVIKSVIADIGTQLSINCIMVSHDAADILSWADRILVMKDAGIIQDGTPKEIYHQPVNEYAAGLFGAYNLMNDLSGFEKQTILRPEQFLISSEKDSLLNGDVKRKTFLGNHYLLDVAIKTGLIQVSVNEDEIKVGDRVHLKIRS